MTDVDETWEGKRERGNADFKTGDFAAALESYSQAISLKPDEPALYSNRAMAFIKMKKFDLAARDANRCLELDPMFFKAYNRLATAYCANAMFAEAASQLRTGHDLALKAGEKEVAREFEAQMTNCALAAKSVAQGEKYLAENNALAAVRSLGTALQLFPDTWRVAQLFAQAKLASDPDDAIQILAKFTSTHSDNPEYLAARAQATFYGGANGAKNATAFLREALSLDPDHSASQKLLKKVRQSEQLRNAATTAYKEKRWKDAEDGYTQTILVDPHNRRLNGILYANRAAARLELKNFKGALQDATSAIDAGNDAPKVYARRARIYEQLEQWDEALRDISRAAEGEQQYEAEVREFKNKHRMSKRKDYYKVLGCNKNASQDEMKRAYKKSALQWHPDKWSTSTEEEQKNAEKNFKEVGEAYSLLSDPQKRQLYDSGQMDNEAEGRRGPGGPGMGGDADMMSMFNMMFAGGGGGMGGMGGRRRGGGNPFGGGAYYEF